MTGEKQIDKANAGECKARALEAFANDSMQWERQTLQSRLETYKPSLEQAAHHEQAAPSSPFTPPKNSQISNATSGREPSNVISQSKAPIAHDGGTPHTVALARRGR